MITHLVVEFNQFERQIIADAGLSLGVAFPEIHEPVPTKKDDRPSTRRAARRIVAMGGRRAQEAWSHDQVVDAVAVMTTQIETLEREAKLDHWLAQHDGVLEPSDEPTSGYQQYQTLATIRANQLVDARRALAVFTEAVRYTASSPDQTSEGPTRFDEPRQLG